MIRINVVLVIVATFCALATVTSQHKARKLFQALEMEQDRGNRLRTEYDLLHLEMSTWAVPTRVEQIARERLKMRVPELVQIPDGRAAAQEVGGRR